MEHSMDSGSTRTLVGGVIGLLAALVFGGFAASAKDGPVECTSKPYVVKIHADWCGSCKALQSVWEQIETDLEEQATAVTFDVSDRVAYAESEATAEQLGIGAFFLEYRKRTGTIAVLDCSTLEPVEVLSGERDFEKYRKAVERASRAS
jgi:thiol-disulfide isomerase/thioredoxin